MVSRETDDFDQPGASQLPPTPAQLDYAERLGIRNPEQMTRTELSEAIGVAVEDAGMHEYFDAEWWGDYGYGVGYF